MPRAPDAAHAVEMIVWQAPRAQLLSTTASGRYPPRRWSCGTVALPRSWRAVLLAVRFETPTRSDEFSEAGAASPKRRLGEHTRLLVVTEANCRRQGVVRVRTRREGVLAFGRLAHLVKTGVTVGQRAAPGAAPRARHLGLLLEPALAPREHQHRAIRAFSEREHRGR